MNHIELFSGCGGLSLGLKQSGYKLILANEISPMAAESFAYNFFDENLEALAVKNQQAKNTLWLNSNYPSLKQRLRENPYTFPAYNSIGYSDLPNDLSELEGKLVVGSIVSLNKLIAENEDLLDQLRSAFGAQNGLDLVSGGPPCQSFSMAGLRQIDCEKNTLPWEFAKFVKYTKPKIAMLENVTGILRAFKDHHGNSFHAWYEVAKVFALVGYVPLCLHINAKLAGIAQNRPRFIMIAVREDHYQEISRKFATGDANEQLFSPSFTFYELVKEYGESLPMGHLEYFDTTKINHRKLFESSFLSGLVNGEIATVKEAIDDLKLKNPSKKSKYIKKLNSTFETLPKRKILSNHEFRKNSDVVKRRFRLYQVLQKIDTPEVTNAVFSVLNGSLINISDTVWDICSEHEYLIQDGALSKFHSKQQFVDYLRAHPTKKQTQKALTADMPAPAALSIPDDACHYDKNELRVLTVREMARIQSFPDNFIFRSKITTGGKARRFEVPQYTQVGNAIPPLLGLKLGQCLSKLL